MKRAVAALAACLMAVNMAYAQPEDGGGRRGRGGFGGDQGGPPGGGQGDQGGRGGFRGRGGPPQNLIFEAIDVDGNGEISKQELRKAAVAILKLDANDDGVITLDEVTPQRGPGGPGGPGGFDPAGMVDRLMELDVDGDGMLSVEEVQDSRFSRMLGNADTNNDGLLDRAELTAAAEAMAQRFGGRGGGPGGQNGPGGFGAGPGGPGGGRGGFGNPDQMTQQLMANDRNGDGVLSPDEVPANVRRMLSGADLDGSGTLDARELAEYARTMQARMQQGGGGRGFGRGGPGGDQQGQGQGQGGPGGGRGGRPQRPEN